MVSSDMLLGYPDCKLPFTVHTDDSDKQLGSAIIQNNKHFAFFSIILSKLQRNYTTTEKALLAIVEYLNQFREILFGYETNIL